MDEISNKTLATLLVVAIVISLAGTFFAMRGVSTVTNFVTGAAEYEEGVTRVNITSKTSILVTQPTVSFGGGYRNETCITDTLSGDNTIELNLSTETTTPPTCWVVDPAASYQPRDLVVENDGNVYVNLTINSTAYTDFFDSCTFTVISAGDSNYSWAAEQGPGAGAGFGSAEETGFACNSSDLVTTLNHFTGTPQFVCGNMSFADTEDEFNFSVELAVPSGPTGQCNATINFQAVRST